MDGAASADDYTRDELDRFYTSPALASAIARQAAALAPEARLLLEPSCGVGRFISAALPLFSFDRVVGVDVDPEINQDWAAQKQPWCRNKVDFYFGDWIAEAVLDPSRFRPDLILANPPFARMVPAKAAGKYRREPVILDHVSKMLNVLAPGGVCGVLAASRFLATTDRRQFFERRRPFLVQQVTPRPSFTGGGTDMSEYVVIWWQKNGPGWARRTEFSWLGWQ